LQEGGATRVCLLSMHARSPTYSPPPGPSLSLAMCLLQIEAVKGIMDGGENPGSFTVGGVKYMVIMSEDPSTKLRGKCKGGGCSICKTNQSLIVGIWAEPVSAAICNKVRFEIIARLSLLYAVKHSLLLAHTPCIPQTTNRQNPWAHCAQFPIKCIKRDDFS